MSEVMISDRSQPVCLEQLRKALCNIMGLNQITDLVDTYITDVVLDVAASAQAAIVFLLFLQGKRRGRQPEPRHAGPPRSEPSAP